MGVAVGRAGGDRSDDRRLICLFRFREKEPRITAWMRVAAAERHEPSTLLLLRLQTFATPRPLRGNARGFARDGAEIELHMLCTNIARCGLLLARHGAPLGPSSWRLQMPDKLHAPLML